MMYLYTLKINPLFNNLYAIIYKGYAVVGQEREQCAPLHKEAVRSYNA